MYIREKADLKELEKMGFYLEGNTYKYDIGDHKYIAVCTINKEIIYPKISKFKKIFYLFLKDNPQKKLEKICLKMWERKIIKHI